MKIKINKYQRQSLITRSWARMKKKKKGKLKNTEGTMR